MLLQFADTMVRPPSMTVKTPQSISFTARGLHIAAHLYHPSPTSPARSGAAIIIVHPWTAIKEQAPANYARVLAAAGFICLTYDAAYQGQSEGEPRNLEDPAQRVEEVKCAVTYLNSLKIVDGERIGVLGICAGGGYVAHAAQTDLRIKAVATAAALCVGTMVRRGFDKDSSNLGVLHKQLSAAGKDRNSDITGETIPIVHLLPSEYASMPPDLPESFRDLASYYRTPRGQDGRATHTCLFRSWDMMANFDAFAFNYMISPRPLLMVTGEKAATRWVSEGAVERVREPKEVVVVEGLTHADLFDRVDEVGGRFVEFFGRWLDRRVSV